MDRMNEKVYVATEMTKIYINQGNEDGYKYSKEEIMNVYNSFYDKLRFK